MFQHWGSTCLDIMMQCDFFFIFGLVTVERMSCRYVGLNTFKCKGDFSSQ